MDKQIRRHLERRGVRLAHGRPAEGLLGTDGGKQAFFRWFYEDVMGFDSMEYRRRFWCEAYRRGHTIGDMPQTAAEFTDPRRHPYNEWLARLLFLMLAMGVSAVVWWLVRVVDAHVRCLRRPTYYEVERARRLDLAKERRRIRRRRTTSPCPTPDMLRAAFVGARVSTSDMVRFGSMLEDLECYVDNSVVWSETEGRIVGRRGGIRQWLRENAPDLSARYKTLMKYKALAKKFRQAVGVCDPTPAAAVLPPEPSGKGRQDGEGVSREHCTERSYGRGRANVARTDVGHAAQADVTHEWTDTTWDVTDAAHEKARELLGRCEGTLASLGAQLALWVSADFMPDENIARTRRRVGLGPTGMRIGRVRGRSSA